MVRWLLKDDGWKRRYFTIISDFPLMCLEELRKTSVCIDGVPDRDSN